ncbi:hypothetical protein ADUPG1_009051, partial [Aduncisulcus paluster]
MSLPFQKEHSIESFQIEIERDSLPRDIIIIFHVSMGVVAYILRFPRKIYQSYQFEIPKLSSSQCELILLKAWKGFSTCSISRLNILISDSDLSSLECELAKKMEFRRENSLSGLLIRKSFSHQPPVPFTLVSQALRDTAFQSGVFARDDSPLNLRDCLEGLGYVRFYCLHIPFIFPQEIN